MSQIPAVLLTLYLHKKSRYAYVEFAEPTHVQHAVVLNDSMFRGRLIKACKSSSALRIQIFSDRRCRLLPNGPISQGLTGAEDAGVVDTGGAIEEEGVTHISLIVQEEGGYLSRLEVLPHSLMSCRGRSRGF